jgi:hypothetical protein
MQKCGCEGESVRDCLPNMCTPSQGAVWLTGLGLRVDACCLGELAMHFWHHSQARGPPIVKLPIIKLPIVKLTIVKLPIVKLPIIKLPYSITEKTLHTMRVRSTNKKAHAPRSDCNKSCISRVLRALNKHYLSQVVQQRMRRVQLHSWLRHERLQP